MKLTPLAQALWLAIATAFVGCAQSQSLDDPPVDDAGNLGGGPAGTTGSGTGGAGSGGLTGAAGTAVSGAAGSGNVSGAAGTLGSAGGGGTAGTTGVAGTSGSGGVSGLGGRGGVGSGLGGTTGAGGRGGSAGGTTGMGGRGGGAGGSSAGGSGGTGGAAPTFTQVYNSILTVSCSGSNCHNPGSQHGVSFSSKANAYSAASSRVKAGNASGSSFYTLMSTGTMPPTTPKVSATNLTLLAAWINAGALNN